VMASGCWKEGKGSEFLAVERVKLANEWGVVLSSLGLSGESLMGKVCNLGAVRPNQDKEHTT
jgi:hypothetical protein